jgi:hypothetical protein
MSLVICLPSRGWPPSARCFSLLVFLRLFRWPMGLALGFVCSFGGPSDWFLLPFLVLLTSRGFLSFFDLFLKQERTQTRRKFPGVKQYGDRRTNQPTDKVSYRGACSCLEPLSIFDVINLHSYFHYILAFVILVIHHNSFCLKLSSVLVPFLHLFH